MFHWARLIFGFSEWACEPIFQTLSKKNGENHLKNIIKKDSIIKREMLHKIHKKTKANANVGNVDN